MTTRAIGATINNYEVTWAGWVLLAIVLLVSIGNFGTLGIVYGIWADLALLLMMLVNYIIKDSYESDNET